MLPVPTAASTVPLPSLVTAAGERAGVCFLEFFAANIRNPHTHRAYAHAASYFLARREAAGIESKIGNHTFRATGITAYLKNGGMFEKAATMANHASPIKLVLARVQLHLLRCFAN